MNRWQTWYVCWRCCKRVCPLFELTEMSIPRISRRLELRTTRKGLRVVNTCQPNSPAQHTTNDAGADCFQPCVLPLLEPKMIKDFCLTCRRLIYSTFCSLLGLFTSEQWIAATSSCELFGWFNRNYFLCMSCRSDARVFECAWLFRVRWFYGLRFHRWSNRK